MGRDYDPTGNGMFSQIDDDGQLGDEPSDYTPPPGYVPPQETGPVITGQGGDPFGPIDQAGVNYQPAVDPNPNSYQPGGINYMPLPNIGTNNAQVSQFQRFLQGIFPGKLGQALSDKLGEIGHDFANPLDGLKDVVKFVTGIDLRNGTFNPAALIGTLGSAGIGTAVSSLIGGLNSIAGAVGIDMPKIDISKVQSALGIDKDGNANTDNQQVAKGNISLTDPNTWDWSGNNPNANLTQNTVVPHLDSQGAVDEITVSAVGGGEYHFTPDDLSQWGVTADQLPNLDFGQLFTDGTIKMMNTDGKAPTTPGPTTSDNPPPPDDEITITGTPPQDNNPPPPDNNGPTTITQDPNGGAPIVNGPPTEGPTIVGKSDPVKPYDPDTDKPPVVVDPSGGGGSGDGTPVSPKVLPTEKPPPPEIVNAPGIFFDPTPGPGDGNGGNGDTGGAGGANTGTGDNGNPSQTTTPAKPFSYFAMPGFTLLDPKFGATGPNAPAADIDTHDPMTSGSK